MKLESLDFNLAIEMLNPNNIFFFTSTKLLTSNLLDTNHEKINRNNQHFFPGYIQNFSGYSRLKVLVVTRKKCWLFPRIFFMVKIKQIGR